MKEWTLFKNNLLTYFKNCDVLSDIASVQMNTERLYYEGFASDLKQTIGQYTKNAEQEIYGRLTNKATYELTIKIIDKEFDEIIDGLNKVVEKHDLQNIKTHSPFSHNNYFFFVQPVYDLHNWYETTKAFVLGTDLLSIKENSQNIDNVQVMIPKIFHELETYNLFKYLVDAYENEKAPSKFSQLLHFIREIQGEHSISDAEYINFIEETYGLRMSKVHQINNKYLDKIQGRLLLLKDNYQKRNKRIPFSEKK